MVLFSGFPTPPPRSREYEGFRKSDMAGKYPRPAQVLHLFQPKTELVRPVHYYKGECVFRCVTMCVLKCVAVVCSMFNCHAASQSHLSSGKKELVRLVDYQKFHVMLHAITSHVAPIIMSHATHN